MKPTDSQRDRQMDRQRDAQAQLQYLFKYFARGCIDGPGSLGLSLQE